MKVSIAPNSWIYKWSTDASSVETRLPAIPQALHQRKARQIRRRIMRSLIKLKHSMRGLNRIERRN
eukprot:2269579-Pyramimonas_sp.AAC.1